MSKTNVNKFQFRKLSDTRSHEAMTAIMHCKGGPMRDRRERRPLEKEREIVAEGIESYEEWT